ncbi:MAG: c-type cytochrome [Gammaproteobacteria bacterium]|nr:c-type cytochrome [Gammaproteobacteria bacterium]
MTSAALGVAHAEPRNIQVCAACHGEDGAGVGFDYVPIIAGTPAAHLEEALFAYKDGARRCVGVPVMCDAVAPLSDDEIVEMAEYYAAMPRLSTDEAFDRQMAAVGKIIHDDLCAQCHVLPSDANVGDALGIPLNGQKGAYLRLALGAYLTGDRETLVPIMSDKLRLLDQDKIDALVHYYASWDPES